MEFDDECTMSDDGGVTTLALPRLRKVLHVSRCYEILGMKIPIAFPPGQIMSWPYKVRGEPYSNPTENFRPGNVALALNKFLRLQNCSKYFISQGYTVWLPIY